MAHVWSGHLTFGLISIPTRLHAAARSEGISFNMLHRDDVARVKQQYICSIDGAVVKRDEIVKGYEYRKDEYIVIEPSELKQIEPQSSKVMEILEFVPSDEVDPIYFDSSYHLEPEEAGQKPYALLVRAMSYGKYYAIAKLFMHNREYTVVIRNYKNQLMLHTMFYESEVRKVTVDSKMEPDINEVNAALGLIAAMSNPWVPEQYWDAYVEEVKNLIKSKLEGTVLTKKQESVKMKPVPDMMEAIKKSLAEVEARKAKK